MLWRYDDGRFPRGRGNDRQEIEEWIERMRIVSRKGTEGVDPVHKDYGVALGQKVFCRRCPSSPSGEVVQEAHAEKAG